MVEVTTLRELGDPLADAAVAELVDAGVSPHMRWPELERLAAVRPAHHPALARLTQQIARVPGWLDRRRLRAGQRLFERHALEATVVFTLDSLVQTYLVPEIADVLVHTGLLTEQVERRLAQTAKMVLDVLGEGALDPGGYGIESVLRVRMLHATVRLGVARHRPRHWPARKQPIDQAEMLLTLHAHGAAILTGLARLGVSTHPEEVDGYQHLWRYVGYLMGVRPDLLPASVEASRRSQHHLQRALFAPTEASRRLTAALHDASALQPPLFLPRPMIVQLTRFLIGESMADALDLPQRRIAQATLDRVIRARARVDPRALPRFVMPRVLSRSGDSRRSWAAPSGGALAPRIGREYFGWMIRRSHRRSGIPFESPSSR
jgi:hypothetical protein